MDDDLKLGRPPDSDPRLPFDQPFTYQTARDFGVSRDELTTLVRSGVLRRVWKGVYVDSVVPDTPLTRAEALRLILPETAVVTDETAARLHMVDLHPPGDLLVAPPVHVFQEPGATRLRKVGAASGERTLDDRDITVVGGLRATTPLRTALDLGRLRKRDRAISALDALLRTESFIREELLAGVERFRGMRWVTQLRELAPLADARAQSPPESIVRLRCIDSGLPPLEPQVEVRREYGGTSVAYLDLANRRLRFAVEYDGKAWHESEEKRAGDRQRRVWVRDEHGYSFAVLEDEHVYGVARGVTAAVVQRELQRHLRDAA